ncbi:hypothetical protein AYK59_20955 [Pseudomonas synxantha]|uniref:hypothetical protein n=1 Tax=Pseudomonas TaxID=286 RepID=UPI0006149524|nr:MULTISPECIES: hypothetical protein [Pseudomonas]AMS22477.1 hypothetical protein AYK59_20955 [Pseudomonas synxantha]MDT3230990.1 hypothetical protein [Pseudomonas sp. rhizo25]WDG40351.1 hypothetical protein PUP72_17000 [Pseudomonas synxantha]
MALVENYNGYEIHEGLTGGHWEGDNLVGQVKAYTYQKNGETSTLTYYSVDRVKEIIKSGQAQF